MRQIKTILLLLCCTGFIASMVFGQGKGVIKGTVKDAKTGEGLPVVNVKIKGTYYGAVTDFDGHYTIPKINPGSYTLEFSLVGYTLVQHTDVKVEADKESIV
ncbi:MAG: carboxypeptidase-like regulatory domain-containing protein, partial [Bacteroidota bacterium]